MKTFWFTGMPSFRFILCTFAPQRETSEWLQACPAKAPRRKGAKVGQQRYREKPLASFTGASQ